MLDLSSNSSIETGKWIFVSAVVSNSDAFLYYNGVLDAMDSVNDKILKSYLDIYIG